MEKNQTNLEDLIKRMENLPVQKELVILMMKLAKAVLDEKLKDTKIGKFLAEKAPHVLDVAGALLPDAGLLGVVKNLIDKDPDLTQEDKQQIHEQLVELYKLEVEDRDSVQENEKLKLLKLVVMTG